MSASAMQNLGRARETAPDARVSASSYLNGPHANGAVSVRTGLQIIPSPSDAGAALQSSASQIARLQSNPEQPTARAASEAYLTQAADRTRIARQEPVSRSQSVNLTA